MNYYQVMLKNGRNIIVQADYFYETGSPSPDCIVFHNYKDKELVAFFTIEEVTGCMKISKEDLDNMLNFWKENDDYGERCDSQREG